MSGIQDGPMKRTNILRRSLTTTATLKNNYNQQSIQDKSLKKRNTTEKNSEEEKTARVKLEQEAPS